MKVLPETSFLDVGRKRTATLALSVLVVFAVAGPVILGSNESNAFLLMTSPISWGQLHAENSMLAYSEILNDELMMRENVPFLQQVIMFTNGNVTQSMYSVRPVYAFLVSSVAWLIGVKNAALLINVLGWLVAIGGMYFLCVRLFQSHTVAMLGAALVATSPGYVIHVHDYSSHLLAFTFYIVGSILLLESRIWHAPQNLRTHLRLGFFLGLACLQYNTAIGLVAVYIVLVLLRDQWWKPIPVALGVIAIQRLWPVFLNIVSANTDQSQFDYYQIEREYLTAALQNWWELLDDPMAFIRAVVAHLGELAFCMAALLPAIVISCITVRYEVLKRNADVLLLFFLIFAMPFAMGLVHAPYASARGYIAFAGSFVVYAIVAWRIGSWIDQQRYLWAIFVLIVGVPAHLVMSYSHLLGNPLPAQAYFIGAPSLGLEFLKELVMGLDFRAVSATGFEASPKLFLGAGDLKSAGALTFEAAESAHWPKPDNTLVSTLVRFPIALILVLAVSSRLSSNRRNLAFSVIAFVTLAGLPLAVGNRSNYWPDIPSSNYWSVQTQSTQLDYEIDLGAECLEMVSGQLSREASSAEIHTGFNSADVTVSIDNVVISTFKTDQTRTHEIPKDILLNALSSGSLLKVSAERDGGKLSYAGWQMSSLPGRRLTESAVLLPIVELRVRDASPLGFLRSACF